MGVFFPPKPETDSLETLNNLSLVKQLKLEMRKYNIKVMLAVQKNTVSLIAFSATCLTPISSRSDSIKWRC